MMYTRFVTFDGELVNTSYIRRIKKEYEFGKSCCIKMTLDDELGYSYESFLCKEDMEKRFKELELFLMGEEYAT